MKPANGWPEGGDSDAGSDSGRDRRTAKRVSTSREVPVVLLAGDRKLGPAVSMRCVNVSKGGMRLEGPAPLVRGGRAAVELTASESRRRAVVGIEVVYSHINHRGDCDAGVRFVKLPEGTVRANFVDERGRLVRFDPEDIGLSGDD